MDRQWIDTSTHKIDPSTDMQIKILIVSLNHKHSTCHASAELPQRNSLVTHDVGHLGKALVMRKFTTTKIIKLSFIKKLTANVTRSQRGHRFERGAKRSG